MQHEPHGTDIDRMPNLRLMGYLAVITPLVATPYLFLDGSTFLLSAAAVLLTAFVVIGSAMRRAPGDRATWLLLGAGIFLWGLGELAWDCYERLGDVTVPVPSWADAGYLGSVPLLAAAVLRLGRGAAHSPYRLRALDLVIVCIGAGTAVLTLVDPAGASSLGPLEHVVLLAYPTTDILLIGVCAYVLLSAGATRPLVLVGTGIASLVVADVGFAHLMLRGAYDTSAGIDVFWPIGYALMGSAALVSGPRADERKIEVNRWAVPGLFLVSTLGPPGAAVATWTAGLPVDTGVALAASATVGVLVVLRLTLISAELQRASADLARAHALITRSNERRGLLLERIDRAVERGRVQVATELHDGPIQNLAALMYRIEAAGSTDGTDVAEIAGLASHGISTEVDNLRRTMAWLRPPSLDERGLDHAIADLAAALRVHRGLGVDLQVEIGHDADVHSRSTMYRMVQESFNNVAQHANATSVSCHLVETPRGLDLVLADDGEGFDLTQLEDAVPDGRLGLASMRERVEVAGGSWTLATAPGRGTRLEIHLPRSRTSTAEEATA